MASAGWPTLTPGALPGMVHEPGGPPPGTIPRDRVNLDIKPLPPAKLAAGYFLAFAALALGVLLWLRGLARLVIPLVLLVVLVVVLKRLVRAIKAPVP